VTDPSCQQDSVTSDHSGLVITVPRQENDEQSVNAGCGT
jgi:hypothetical protein